MRTDDLTPEALALGQRYDQCTPRARRCLRMASVLIQADELAQEAVEALVARFRECCSLVDLEAELELEVRWHGSLTDDERSFALHGSGTRH